jgi:Domain of unknown function (DUF4190)
MHDVTPIDHPVTYTPMVQERKGTNGMAVASFTLSLLWIFGLGSLLAVIFAVVGRKQIRTNGQGGDGLAIAGLIIGIIGLVGVATIIILAIAAGNSVSAYDQCVANATTLAQQAAC